MFGNSTASSLSKSLGYTKSRTYNFKKVKEHISQKQSRFKKKSSAISFDSGHPKSQTLLSSKPAETVIELGDASTLPPIWIDIYEETQDKLKRIHEISKEEKTLVANRIKKQFGDHSELDRQIEKKNSEATRLLHECEANLGKITHGRGNFDETEPEKKIKQNIQRSLATQIQEAAALLRRQQKGLLDKLQDLNTTGSTDLDTNEPNEFSEDLQDMMMAEDIARERDEELNKLIDSINDLNHLFKQMNHIVLEQGTIVDRIDYNLESAVHNTGKAKKELYKANKAMDSKCGQSVIRVLVILNIIFAILLLLKFGKRN